MGIVKSQSFKNTITTYVGFGIGAINTLFLYTNFMSDTYYGLVGFILSTANIMMPLMAFGTQNTLIKFYSSYKTRNSINSFLTLMIFLPLLLIVPIGLIGYYFFDLISDLLSQKNPIIKDYIWLIYISAIAFAYFEIFYAWTKVQMQSVFGNIMKEVFHRVGIMILLFCLYFELLTVTEFIYGVVGVYLLRMMLMKLYAYYIRRPVIRFDRLPNTREILKYTSLIIIAGSIANIILEIDKFMIGEYIKIENVAYYAVAIYIASVISVPARSMHQITNPITAKLLNERNMSGLKELYQKSSLNLFIIGGLIFLLIGLNLHELYRIIPPEFRGGLSIVFLIGLAKLYDDLMGNNNAILFNSKYYRVVLILGVLLAVLAIVLNMLLIPEYQIYGAAYATFLAVFLYNSAKLIYVKYKLDLQPFTMHTVKTAILIAVMFVLFYYWDFPFHPIINITLKSLIIVGLYVYVVYRSNLSDDISSIIKKLLKLS
ncbi:MAG: oligosaccharide flippase family protein [Bacteroidia bacterium]|nr:oligosaccharide flippase family protein [Bacteroidia bacterium]